jgi:hypothetical protein
MRLIATISLPGVMSASRTTARSRPAGAGVERRDQVVETDRCHADAGD